MTFVSVWLGDRHLTNEILADSLAALVGFHTIGRRHRSIAGKAVRRLGSLNPKGDTAVYLTRICAASPIILRRCVAGETGVAISRYHGIGEFDCIAIPLMPYLYGSIRRTSHLRLPMRKWSHRSEINTAWLRRPPRIRIPHHDRVYIWSLSRGLTSCLFFFLAGFAFVLATYRRDDRPSSPTVAQDSTRRP